MSTAAATGLFMIWNVLCYAGFFVCLARASRKHLRTFIAIIVGVFLVGVLYMLGYVFRLPFAMRLNFSLVYALLVVTALELSLDLGLIPSMVRFDKSFAKIPLDLRIVDLDGKTYLATTKAEPSGATPSATCSKNSPRTRATRPSPYERASTRSRGFGPFRAGPQFSRRTSAVLTMSMPSSSRSTRSSSATARCLAPKCRLPRPSPA